MKNNNIKIQNKLKECRIKAGFTQFQVMLKLGFHSTDRLSKWEQGHQLPNLINLFKLAKTYNVTPNELFPEISEIQE
jgi:transcriptional regulator with XRE-family HTH domain